LPPDDGKIKWTKFLRDLVDVRFRGAFVLKMTTAELICAMSQDVWALVM
jgi:sugar phosphate isomerase/epimerase